MVDQHLSWRAHIDYISKKVSKLDGILHKIQNYLDKKDSQEFVLLPDIPISYIL